MKLKRSIVFIICINIIFFFIILPAIYSLELDDQKMADFFNDHIPVIMEEHNIAGIVICLVQNGGIVYSRGFGYSDIENQMPVDPAKTLFRAGSISKLFTWTAVMQLVEQGKLDLDEDVNLYLEDFRLPDTFPEPITMKHLMSHTPGFEDKVIGLFTKDESKLMPLARVIEDQKLKRIWPPGKVVSYSNYGISLAGYIVEQKSGMPFEEYIEMYIFKPLKMNYSTFKQPPPDHLQAYLSKGYSVREKIPVEQGFEYVQGTPAGGISITAHDMARFLLAHLYHNPQDGNAILQPETLKQMHSTHFKPDPNANGLAHGFIEYNMHDQRIIGHDGDTIYFHSSSGIIPEHNFGFFFSANTDTGMVPIHFLLDDFLKEFFPAPTGTDRAIPNSRNLKEYTGTYASTRRSESDLSKVMSLFMQSNVRVSKDGKSLDIFDIFTRKYVSCVEVKERTFQRSDGYDSYTFLTNNKNEINAVIFNRLPVMTFRRIPAWEDMSVLLIIEVLVIFLILSGIIVRPVGLMAIFSKKHKATGLARWAGYTGSLLILFYLVYIILLIIYLAGDVVFTLPSPLLFVVPVIILIITIAMMVFCIAGWKNNYWKLPGRIYYTCITVISFGFLWLLYYWEFLFPG